MFGGLSLEPIPIRYDQRIIAEVLEDMAIRHRLSDLEYENFLLSLFGLQDSLKPIKRFSFREKF